MLRNHCITVVVCVVSPHDQFGLFASSVLHINSFHIGVNLTFVHMAKMLQLITFDNYSGIPHFRRCIVRKQGTLKLWKVSFYKKTLRCKQTSLS